MLKNKTLFFSMLWAILSMVNTQADAHEKQHLPKVVDAQSSAKIDFPGHQTFILSHAEDTPSTTAVMELVIPAKTFGAPPHTHQNEDEYFYVLEGEVEFLDRDKTILAGAGSLVVLPRGHLHGFWNSANKDARLLLVVSPGEFASFFDHVVAKIREEHANDPRKIGQIMAQEAKRFGVEINMQALPENAKRLMPKPPTEN